MKKNLLLKSHSCHISELVAEKVSETFGADKKFSSLGLVMHSQGGGLVICGGKDREKILTTNKIGVESASEEWQFFTNLITTYTDNTGRLDIIATSLGKILCDDN